MRHASFAYRLMLSPLRPRACWVPPDALIARAPPRKPFLCGLKRTARNGLRLPWPTVDSPCPKPSHPAYERATYRGIWSPAQRLQVPCPDLSNRAHVRSQFSAMLKLAQELLSPYLSL